MSRVTIGAVGSSKKCAVDAGDKKQMSFTETDLVVSIGGSRYL